LGQDGHVKIADLGLAKPDMFEGELAYSFCGSPEYMSPEMILQ
jgi:serum/glucocorticoid-regulated kinase 2